MKEQLKAARQSSVPLIAISTADQRATMVQAVEIINQNSPCLSYDIVNGLIGLNQPGQSAFIEILGDADPSLFTDPVTALSGCLAKAPNKTVVFLLGSDRFLDDKRSQQAVANCRDPFKSTGRCLILLSPTRLSLPTDLQNDTLYLDDTVPTDEGRAKILTELYQDASTRAKSKGTEFPELKPEVSKVAVSATRGLSDYAVEQTIALSMSKAGINTETLWLKWRQAINATKGLTVDQSGSTLDDIGGLDNFKEFSKRIVDSEESPSAIIRIEEIEKAMAGSGGESGSDSSGTSQSLLQYILTWMQEEEASGLIALGPAGSGKSLSSVAMGSAGNIPTITLDLGALKGGLVGETEENTRKALSVIKALSGKNTFWIATCNGVVSLKTELKRRFQYGIWFFDLPNEQERKAIWKIWLKKYPTVQDVRPDDTGWTGAEIATAVRTAFKFRCTPKEAAQWIVPVSVMDGEGVEKLRKQANNKYLSASYSGRYQYVTGQQQAVQSKGRMMDMTE
jgi:SpoVK/Ycf46/Vps4 family AAA+-type ATPase